VSPPPGFAPLQQQERSNPSGNRITRKRGDYFRKLKRERELTKVLSYNPPPQEFSRRTRSMIHRVYYRTLPCLFARLTWYKDRQILQAVEEAYYYWLVSSYYSRPRASKPARLGQHVRMTNPLDRYYLVRQQDKCPDDLDSSIRNSLTALRSLEDKVDLNPSLLEATASAQQVGKVA